MTAPDLFEVFRQMHEPLLETAVPEMAETVNAPQVPAMPKQWSWNTKTVTYAALVAAGVGLSVWFVLAYNKWSKEGGHEHGDGGSGTDGGNA